MDNPDARQPQLTVRGNVRKGVGLNRGLPWFGLKGRTGPGESRLAG